MSELEKERAISDCWSAVYAREEFTRYILECIAAQFLAGLSTGMFTDFSIPLVIVALPVALISYHLLRGRALLYAGFAHELFGRYGSESQRLGVAPNSPSNSDARSGGT